jgi:DNA-binding CsgD family transcriptional regulator
MSTSALTLETIASKAARRLRPLRNLDGALIELDEAQLCIIRHMCNGLRHKQTAAEIGISEKYIANQLASALRIIGCKTHAQLGVWAAKQGIL